MNDLTSTFGPYYFEDFELGATYRHARGKTVKESDAVTICNLVLNTAEGHFNDHKDIPSPKYGVKQFCFGSKKSIELG